MKILIVNLKLFYQRRGLWFWYLFLAPIFFALLVITKIRGQGTPVPYLFICLILGALTADLQGSVLSKPLSFCLPNQRDLRRGLFLGLGSVIGLVIGIAFFRYHELGSPRMLLVILAAGSAGTMLFLLGVWLFFKMRNAGLAGMVFPLAVLASILPEHTKPIERLIVSFPLSLIAVGALVCVFAWRWLGSGSFARRYCGESFISIADGWNMVKIQKIAQKRSLQKRPDESTLLSDRLEDFFLERIRSCRAFSMSQYMLGNLYNMFGKFFWPWRKIHMLFVVAIIPVMGYMNGVIVGYKGGASGHDISDIIFLAPAMGLVQLDLVPHRSMLLPAGRIQKYNIALATGAIVAVLATVFAVMMTALSVPLSSVMPDIVVKGHTVAYHALHARGFYISLILVPIALVIGTLFSGKNGPRMAFMFFGMILMQLWINPTFADIFNPLKLLGVPGVIILIAASWIGSVLLLRYHCRKQNLVGQGR